MKGFYPTMWRINLKLTGWWPVAVSALLLGTFFVLESLMQGSPNTQDPSYPRRAIETIVPLAFALQAAFLLGPDNEPAMELLLSYSSATRKTVLGSGYPGGYFTWRNSLDRHLALRSLLAD